MASNNKFSITAILGVDSSAMAKGLRDAKKDVAEFGKELHDTMVKAAKLAAAAMATALVGVTAASLKEFKTYEQELLQLFTLLPNATQKELKDLEGQILEFSRVHGILPVTVAKAIYEAVSAGKSVKEAFEIAQNAMQLSIGTAANFDETVKLLVTTLNAFGTAGMTAEHAANVFARTIEIGNLRGKDLVSTFHGISSVAENTKISFEQVAAALAQLTVAGVPAEIAITQLRSALVSMMAAEDGHVKSMEKALLASGSSIKSYEEFKQLMLKKPDGLIQAMMLLRKLTENDPLGELKPMIGRIEGLQAILSLTNGDGKKFNETLIAISNSAGVAKAQFQVMEGGLVRLISSFRANLSVGMIKFAESILPILKSIIFPITEEIKKVMANINWDDFAKKAFAAFEEIKKFVGPILKNLFDGLKGIDLGALFNTLLPMIKLLLHTIKEMSEVVKELLPLVAPAVIKGYLLWYGRIIAVVATIIKAVKAFMPTIKKIFEVINQGLDALFALLGNFSVDGLKNFGASVVKFLEGLSDIAQTLAKNFFDILKKIFMAGIKKLFSEKEAGMILGVVDGLIADILGYGKEFYATLFKMGKMYFDFVVGQAKYLFELLKSHWPEIKVALASIFTGVVQFLKDVFKVAKDLLPVFLKAFEIGLKFMKLVQTIIWPVIVVVVKWLLIGLGVLFEIYKVLSPMFRAIISFFTWLLSGAFSILKVIFDLMQEIEEFVQKAIKTILNLLSELQTFSFGIMIAIFDKAMELLKPLFDFIASFFEMFAKAWNVSKDLIFGTLDLVWSKFKGFIDFITEAISGVFKMLTGWLGGIVETAEKAWAKIKGIFSKTKKAVTETGTEISKVEKEAEKLNKTNEEGLETLELQKKGYLTVKKNVVAVQKQTEELNAETELTSKLTGEIGEEYQIVRQRVEEAKTEQIHQKVVTEEIGVAVESLVDGEITYNKHVVSTVKSRERELAVLQEIEELKKKAAFNRKTDLPPIEGFKVPIWQPLQKKPVLVVQPIAKKPVAKKQPVTVQVQKGACDICTVLTSMDKSLKSIDFTLKGKFVNQ